MPLQDALNEFVKLCAKHGCKTELIKKNDIKFDVKISGGDTSSLLWDAAKVGEFQGNPPTMYTLVDSNIPTHTYLKTGMYKD
jgi:hypothetical protein